MTIEQLNNEITALVMRIGKVKANTNLPSTEDDIKLQMHEFLKVLLVILLFAQNMY